VADLNSINLTIVSDSDLFSVIEDFTRISLPQADRQSEGYTVDFKREWSDESLRVIAAFANTFGGIIIVGVSEVSGRADQIIGVLSSREVKTQFASAIASNISPTPEFEIAECLLPSDPSRRLAVIRVRPGNRIHYLVKKGSHPVYIRNEDQAIPAPAADLRALVERDYSYRSRTAISGSAFESIGPSFKVTEMPPPPSPDRARGIRSAVAQSYMRMGIQPTSTVSVDLDYQSEERFKSSVSSRFHELVSPVLDDFGAESEVRDSKSYIYKVLRKDPDFETLWALTDSGTIGFATALGIPVAGLSGLAWSLPDLAANIASSLELANEILVDYGYFGPIRLDLEVTPGGAIILRDAGLFGTLFRQDAYPHAWPVVIPQYRQAPANGLCRAEMTLGFNVRSGDWKSEVADLLNRILRGFGFAADLKTLRGCIKKR